MNLHTGLLEQAHHLLYREPRRPRQISLRRAVSAAYYALFHLLVDEASGRIVGMTDKELHSLTARAFLHSEMATVCRKFVGGYGGLPQHLQVVVKSGSVSADLVIVARVFIALQRERHAADYERTRLFERNEVSALVQRATDAFAAWERVRRTSEARIFLLALLLDKHWNR